MAQVEATATRRLSVSTRVSFPDVNVEQAKRFAETGTMLKNCSPGSFCFFPARKRRRYYRVDEGWQFLQEGASPSAPSSSKWHLGDLSAVKPTLVDDARASSRSSQSPASKASKLDREFLVVIQQRDVKFRAENREEVKLWVTALETYLSHRRTRRNVVQEVFDFMTSHFLKADADESGGLQFSEFRSLLKRLNLGASTPYLSELFRTFDRDGNLCINEEEFRELFTTLMVKKHIREIFIKYSVVDDGDEHVMPIADYIRFLGEVQGQRGLSEEALRAELLTKLGEPFVTPQGDALTEAGFSSVMCGKKNSIFDPEHSHLHQDMTQPLSHYWINCSHNTYLEGAQIGGNASVGQYLQVLSQGCRCVEIDLWDGPRGEPQVTHGYTLSGKLSFEEVAQALNDHGFHDNDFPLILSLENHCTDQQIVRVGEILKGVFQDRLLTHPPEGHAGEPLVSPEAAKGRVLIKAALAKVPGEGEDADIRLSGSLGLTASRLLSIRAPPVWRSHEARPLPADLATGIRLFNSLIYLVSRKWRSLSEERHPCNISSFSEARAIAHCKKYSRTLVAYHRENLSRIYPPGQNVTSANLAPLIHWAHGSQLVALNFQTLDTSVLLNEGMFREQNGGFGYVLKPRSAMSPWQPDKSPELKLKLTVLSAHFLPRPAGMEAESQVTTPYVVVAVHSSQGGRVQQETQPVKDDGLAPSWEETFQFEVDPDDVSILSFEVYHQNAIGKPSFMAAAAFPVMGLRPGVRWVPLWDSSRREVPNCGVLVRLVVEDVGFGQERLGLSLRQGVEPDERCPSRKSQGLRKTADLSVSAEDSGQPPAEAPGGDASSSGASEAGEPPGAAAGQPPPCPENLTL